MNIKTLQQLISDDYIKVNKHPSADLFIYNYTATAQYEQVWNEWTLACRGLIMDADFNVIARPFPKFFNLEEYNSPLTPRGGILEEIPPLGVRGLPFEVYEKLDGSLGILYYIDNQACIASRGSFVSEQAIAATELLQTKYADSIPLLDKTKTYLFEIIYPENRIVVHYGDERKLVLLAIIDTASGDEFPLEDIGFEIVKKYDGLNDLYKLKALEEDNKEGFVVKFKSGFRLKVKFEEYQRIHKIVTQISNVSIWEYVKEGKDLTPILEKVPDEFYAWVKATHAKLLADYAEIEAQAKSEFKVLENRKETAFYFLTCQHPTILFKMLDSQDYSPIIWKLLKPVFQKPFADIL
jgi:tRNA splicing ligase